jgi:hypothetical protein
MPLNLKNNFSEFCRWVQPADFIALIIILGGFALKFKGADGVISFLLVSVAFYYFGKKNELLKTYLQNFIK